MHELAVCQALLEQVERLAQQHRVDRVEIIEIAWGPLSGVEITLLQQAFNIARIGTVAEQANFVVKHLPIRVICKICGEETQATSNQLICGACQNWQTQLMQGDELILSRVVLNSPELVAKE